MEEEEREDNVLDAEAVISAEDNSSGGRLLRRLDYGLIRWHE